MIKKINWTLPADPPAKIVPIKPRLPSVPNLSAAKSFTYSYVKKYKPLAGTSVNKNRKKYEILFTQFH